MTSRRSHPVLALAASLLASALVAGCSALPGTPAGGPTAGGSPSSGVSSGVSSGTSSGTPSGTPSGTASASASASAAPPPRPTKGSCHRFSYDQALAPTPTASDVPCSRPHTAETFQVGTVDNVVAGHLLAIDSQRVQGQVARTCPQRLAGFLGGDADDLRLTMLRSVWFTPTLAEAAAGADWYRCDVIAVARDGSLAQVTGRLAGVLSSAGSAAPYGMCGTAKPGAAGFHRVMCRERHTWRAIAVVHLGDSARYPGEAQVRAAGEETCQEAGAAVAEDSLEYEWGYEWPTAQLWNDGQHHGLCWAPD